LAIWIDGFALYALAGKLRAPACRRLVDCVMIFRKARGGIHDEDADTRSCVAEKLACSAAACATVALDTVYMADDAQSIALSLSRPARSPEAGLHDRQLAKIALWFVCQTLPHSWAVWERVRAGELFRDRMDLPDRIRVGDGRRHSGQARLGRRE